METHWKQCPVVAEGDDIITDIEEADDVTCVVCLATRGSTNGADS